MRWEIRILPGFQSRWLAGGFLLVLLFGSATQVHADLPLFESREAMDITIPVDFASLCRPREDESCDYVPSEILYEDDKGAKRSVPIEIKIRGGWRSLTRNCSAPLLWVRFDRASTGGTPFDGLSILPLTTHCGQGFSLASAQNRTRRSDWEQYLLREYLGYRIYRVLSDRSVRARLLRITYLDPDKSGREISNYAFFTEHFDQVAARTGAQVLDRGSFEADRLDPQSAAVLALFEYLIGNTDWSIARERNIILMGTNDGRQVPVPYDLDMSGLVNAAYAGPAVGLPINDVTDRYFLGFCQPGTDWDALFAQFLEAEPRILALPDEIPDFDNRSRRWESYFLGQFFDILHSPEERRERIIKACQPWPPSPIDHTTPEDER
ncbi:MAG: hypothetical protein PVI46_05435 [Lysobacterales bacterium]|jgi:hypothetical protein